MYFRRDDVTGRTISNTGLELCNWVQRGALSGLPAIAASSIGYSLPKLSSLLPFLPAKSVKPVIYLKGRKLLYTGFVPTKPPFLEDLGMSQYLGTPRERESGISLRARKGTGVLGPFNGENRLRTN